jgi:hypothetical protein
VAVSSSQRWGLPIEKHSNWSDIVDIYPKENLSHSAALASTILISFIGGDKDHYWSVIHHDR